MNNKGQALVEFVIILPIFILMLFAVIDFGTIYNVKNELENNSIDIVELIKNDVSMENIINRYDDIDINIQKDNEYLIVRLEKSVLINTPGLNRIFGEEYMVKVERTIYDD